VEEIFLFLEKRYPQTALTRLVRDGYLPEVFSVGTPLEAFVLTQQVASVSP